MSLQFFPLFAVFSIPAALIFVGLGQGPALPDHFREMVLTNTGGISRGADGETKSMQTSVKWTRGKIDEAWAAAVHTRDAASGLAPILGWVPWTCCTLVLSSRRLNSSTLGF